MIREKELFRPMILAWLEGEIAGLPSPIEPMAHSIRVLARAIAAARVAGIVGGPLQAERLAWQIHHGARFAAIQWSLADRRRPLRSACALRSRGLNGACGAALQARPRKTIRPAL